MHYHGIADWLELVEQPRPRCVRTATVATEVLDSGVQGCVWHRVVLEGDVPTGARVEVRAGAADDAALLQAPGGGLPQPPPLRRRTGHQPYTAPLGSAFELLLQRVQGRFARVALTLSSDGRRSPAVRSLEITAPRFSLRDRYLPGVYAEEDQDRVLERFLANPEGLITELEGRIAAAQALMSPSAAPSEALDWLAGWLDLVLDPGFGDRRRRLFLRHAHRLLATRGTPHGLQLALRLALDPAVDDAALTDPRLPPTAAIRIVEAYHLRHGRAVAAGDVTEVSATGGEARRWTPGDGVDALHARWRAETGERRFPARPETVTARWEAFCARVLGYRPGTTAIDDARRRAFLARRHGTLARAAAAHGVAPEVVGDWPRELPEGAGALRDWHDGGAVVLAAARHSHRFRVLLPVRQGERPDDAAVVERRAIAERVLALQKPAHTVASVALYWSAFRIGYARLGFDSTPLDRLPFHHDAVLGSRGLGEAVLGGPRTPLAGAAASLEPEPCGEQPLPPGRNDGP